MCQLTALMSSDIILAGDLIYREGERADLVLLTPPRTTQNLGRLV